MARLPFTLAEPGTDPTRNAPPRPRRNWLKENKLLVVGLAVFLAVGYWKFIRKPPRPEVAAAVEPTPTIAPTAAPGGLFAGDGGDTGFFPTAEPAATATVTATKAGCTVYCYVASFTDELCDELLAANPGCTIEWRD